MSRYEPLTSQFSTKVTDSKCHRLLSFFGSFSANIFDHIQPMQRAIPGKEKHEVTELLADSIANKLRSLFEYDLTTGQVTDTLDNIRKATSQLRGSSYTPFKTSLRNEIATLWPAIEEQANVHMHSKHGDSVYAKSVLQFCHRLNIIPSAECNAAIQTLVEQGITRTPDDKVMQECAETMASLAHLGIAPNDNLLATIEDAIDCALEDKLASPDEKAILLNTCAIFHACGTRAQTMEALAQNLYRNIEDTGKISTQNQIKQACLYFDWKTDIIPPTQDTTGSNQETRLKKILSRANHADVGTPKPITSALQRDVDHTTRLSGNKDVMTEVDGPTHANTHPATGKKFLNGGSILQSFLLAQLVTTAVIMRMDADVTEVITRQAKPEHAVQIARHLYDNVAGKLPAGAYVSHIPGQKISMTPLGQYLDTMHADINQQVDPS